MEVNDVLIDKLAHLARLEFTGEEKTAMRGEFEKMLDFVGKIDEVDVAGVEPLIHITLENNHLRDDVVSHPITVAEALKNAPKKDTDYFRVPKVKN